MTVRSMTGFARVRRQFGEIDVTASVKSVNHRGLDMHFRMAPELDACEMALRAAVKRHVTRGHLQIHVRVDSTAPGEATATVNQGLLEAYLTAYRRTAAVHGLQGEPDLNAALRIPGIFATIEPEPDPALEGHLVTTLEDALVALNRFRGREGHEIASEMRTRIAALLRAAKRIGEIRGEAIPDFHRRLTDKLRELLDNVPIDPQRLAQEVAYLVDRSDISEELTRLKVHAVQLDELLSSGGEVGKKLDFLVQEMHRETNTILSKSTGAGDAGLEITELALSVKAELEKIREQGLNLE